MTILLWTVAIVGGTMCLLGIFWFLFELVHWGDGGGW